MVELKTWRLIDTEIGPAGWNMAVDEALLEGFRAGDLPILRLYGWEPSLSAGRFSNLDKSIDHQRLEAKNLACVRRISGGGILVHGDDLSYALILPRESVKEYGVKESYRHLCRFLFRLYENLGYTARFAAEEGLQKVQTDICLAGNEAYDITIGGNKMGGNAQRHTHDALLQHGTIPIRLDEARFAPFFIGKSGLESAASLERLGNAVEYEILTQKVREAFGQTYGVTLVRDFLRPDEETRAKELLASKYSQRRWNLYGEY